MNLTSTNSLLARALDGGYAVPSYCVWNADGMDVVMRTAERLNAPVILMTGVVELGLMSAAKMASTFRAIGSDYEIAAALHLDHGDTIERAQECIACGYTSVMLDLSSSPFEHNVSALSKLAHRAHASGVPVEAELGAVGKVDDSVAEGSIGSTLTDPDQAGEFVERTGVDSLAVSIGNAHGNYVSLPELDFDRLEQIRNRVDIPLVLHGGSGTPEPDLKRAISLGIAKVNIASDLVKAIRDTLRSLWDAGEKPWVPEALAEANKKMESEVERWILKLGAQGKTSARGK